MTHWIRTHGRRQGRLLSALASILLVASTTASAADDFLSAPAIRKGNEALQWSAKLTCGTTEPGVTRYGVWEGYLYSRAPGEKDRTLLSL